MCSGQRYEVWNAIRKSQKGSNQRRSRRDTHETAILPRFVPSRLLIDEYVHHHHASPTALTIKLPQLLLQVMTACSYDSNTSITSPFSAIGAALSLGRSANQSISQNLHPPGFILANEAIADSVQRKPKEIPVRVRWSP